MSFIEQWLHDAKVVYSPTTTLLLACTQCCVVNLGEDHELYRTVVARRGSRPGG